MSNAEYYVRRTAPSNASRQFFVVTKFEGGEEPSAIYHVTWDTHRDEMQCDCPNRRRGKGTDDKHGRLIREWICNGEPVEAMTIDSPNRNYSDDIPF